MYESSVKLFPKPQGFAGDPGPDERTNWGGYRLRTMMHCAYTLAFLCMLRFDEVLKVQAHHIEVMDDFEESGHIRLTLPFRKTHQLGGRFISEISNM